MSVDVTATELAVFGVASLIHIQKKKKRKRLWALLFRFCCLTKLQFLAIQLTPILFHAHRNEISYRFAFIYTFSCVKSPFTTVLYPQMFIGMCTGSQTEMH